MSVLELRDLSVTYSSEGEKVPAVRGVNLTIEPGDTVGLAGESGCGKSTIAGAVLRLLPKGTEVTGSVLLDGEDVYAMKPGRLRAVRWTSAAIVFQGALHSLNPVRRVGQQIEEAILLHAGHGSRGSVRTRVGELLEKVGLPAARADRYPHQLSGGQRQRVLIAAAMALQPSLLLADEPVASLDASIRGEILALMRSFVDSHGVSIIAVTHDLGLAWNIADRVAVMYLGRIVEVGPAEDVLRAPKHPYTRALLSVVPEIEGLEQQILVGETPDPSRVPSGCRFHPRCPVVASGEADRLGFGDRCRGVDLELEPEVGTHQVACHAVQVSLG